MRSVRFFSLILVFLSFTSCQKNEDGDDSFIWVESMVFQCCNVWGDPGVNDDIISMISTFFVEEDMTTRAIEIVDRGTGVLCTHCCKCPTDQVIRVRLHSVFKEKAASFGFLVP